MRLAPTALLGMAVALSATAQAPADDTAVSAIVCTYSHVVEDGHTQRATSGEDVFSVTYLADDRVTLMKHGRGAHYQGQVIGQMVSAIAKYAAGASRLREQIIVDRHTGAFRSNSKIVNVGNERLVSTFGSCRRAPDAESVSATTDEARNHPTENVQE